MLLSIGLAVFYYICEGINYALPEEPIEKNVVSNVWNTLNHIDKSSIHMQVTSSSVIGKSVIKFIEYLDTTTITEKVDNQVIKITRKYKGKLHGKQIENNLNGTLKQETNYYNGELHGDTLIWYENGTSKSSMTYFMGIKHGKQVEWYQNRQAKYVMNFNQGQENDAQTCWYENGQLESNLYYVLGKPQSLQQGWYPDGKPKFSDNYLNGEREGKSMSWHENGLVQSDMSYSKTTKFGNFKEYYPNGEQKDEYDFTLIDGKICPVGVRINWYINGKISKFQFYSRGKLHGKEIYYSEEGIETTNEWVHGYEKKKINIVKRTLKKAKWIRLAKLMENISFCEWYYHPDNFGFNIIRNRYRYLIHIPNYCVKNMIISSGLVCQLC
jgi:antitoxin component YwqK of YwqJK toxin-antitoxin module